MAITRFYHFAVRFADAAAPAPAPAEHSDAVYRIEEGPQGRWAVFEDGRPVALDDAQHARLARLLAALQPPPSPLATPPAPGCDGTWLTVVVGGGGGDASYRWWVRPPTAWAALGALTDYVRELADRPRVLLAERNRSLGRQLFERLAARDEPGLLALYAPHVEYRSPLFELRGPAVAAMWRMWWRELPDARVTWRESDIRPGSASWSATYTFPPTGRRVEHRLSSDLAFADGAVVRHVDRFGLREWAGQAYGPLGGAVGGWRLFERLLAAGARRRLASFGRAQQKGET